MKNLKKLFMTTIIGLFALGLFSIANTVKAESAGPLYLGIGIRNTNGEVLNIRSSGYGYEQGEKKVWKINTYDNTTDVTADSSNLIYCIRAGAGFGSDASTNEIKAYNQKFNLKDLSSISTPYNNALPTGENYNKLMWVLDHMYTGIGSNDDTARNKFLASVIPSDQYDLLTDDDVDVVQQLAIWYFTNPTGTYHYDNIQLYINSTKGTDANYKSIEDFDATNGFDRQTAAQDLYKYYINNASGTYTSTSATGAPVSLTKDSATMQTVSSNYIAGPYKLSENTGYTNIDYSLDATYKNYGTSTSITPTIVVKDTNGNYVTTTKTLKELAQAGTEFYLEMPTNSNINGIDMTITYSYSNRTAEYWSVTNAPDTEQPVVIVKNTTVSNTLGATIVIPSTFDLSLRKFITGINGVAPTVSREPKYDVTALKAGTATTATYNHTKDPLKLQIGDIVTYTIRVYNEGATDGYVTEITDHLPSQLEYIADDEINKTYMWQIDTNSIVGTHVGAVKSAYLSKANETTAGGNKIAAYNNGDTLAYKDVQIRCKVVATDPMPDKITNIADITGFTDGDGNSVVDRDSQASNVTLPTKETYTNGDDKDTTWPTYKDAEINRGETYIPGQQDDDDFEKVQLKSFDLALRKSITTVIDSSNNSTSYNRTPEADTTKLKAGTETTATYNHSKSPVSVTVGDTVIYTLRIYNEGETDGYANEITDHLPGQLQYLPDSDVNKKYEWTMYDSTGAVTTDSTKAVTIKTDYLSKTKDGQKNTYETDARSNKIVAFDGTSLSSKEIQVACKVIATDPMPTKITNIAEISAFVDSNGNAVTDRDSQANNATIPTGTELENYKDDEITKSYVPGQQDDDDFEKLIIKQFDLSLRKFITKVGDTDITSRIPNVDPKKLIAGTDTTATYNHAKDAVKVDIGDTVIYTIRVYNEGGIDGYASEIKDHLPDQLKFLPDNEVNKTYEWTADSTGKIITTDYLSKAKETTTRVNKISAFNGENLSYKDIQVACEVVATTPMVNKITNIADISAATDGAGNKATDRDSETDNVKIPSDLPNYNGNGTDGDYTKGQQDDDDFEKLQIGEFDLSLRKFITAVNTTNVTTREPVVDTSTIATKGTATYTHTKDPVLVSNGNIVTYTIRVYNEGDTDGFAEKIKDDIPEGLKFLSDNDTNKTYRWVMLDKDGNETTNVDDAVSIQSDYLSKEQGDSAMKSDTKLKTNPNLLTAYNGGSTLDYRDVKVAFEVTMPNTSDRIIINQAQISEDKDKNGKDVTDKDSTPDKWVDGEDDQDIEKIKVQYFDLSLRKWVTQAIVIDNDQQTVTETGHKAEDDPEAIVKVDLKKKKLNSVTVKFRYSIRVTNEGQIAGYAKEIKDYIPEGLKFVAEDNPLWTQVDDKTITTDQAKDVLLQPGDTTEVEVLLTWINSEDNLKLQDNWAEISKDYNDYNSPDIDSTPNNKKEGEDDIDDAPVILSIQTGQAQRYVTISGVVLIILATGIILIKKFVV